MTIEVSLREVLAVGRKRRSNLSIAERDCHASLWSLAMTILEN